MVMKQRMIDEFLEWWYLSFRKKNSIPGKFDTETLNKEVKQFSFQKRKVGMIKFPLAETDIKSITSKVKKYNALLKGSRMMTLAEAVKKWQKKPLEDFYKDLSINGLKKLPKVFLGPAVSTGYFRSGTEHYICIDPTKSRSFDKKMQVLKFEVLNATRATAYSNLTKDRGTPTEKAWKSVKLEYGSSRDYVNMLIHRNDAKNIADLVEKKKFIEDKILKKYREVTYDKKKIMKSGVSVPLKSDLGNQDQRDVLFFYRIRRLTPEQKLEAYAYTAHTPGGTSTLDQEIDKYKKQNPQQSM